MNKRYFNVVALMILSIYLLATTGLSAAEPLKESNKRTSQSVNDGKVSAAKITVESSNGGPGIIKMQADYPPKTVLEVKASLTVKEGYYKVELLNSGKPSLVLEAKDSKVFNGKGLMSANANGDVEYRVTSKNAKNVLLELSLKPVPVTATGKK